MKLAIIGAGPAGLATAWALKNSTVEVQVFEKSRGVSGRAASRSRHGARFDFGANYFRLDTPDTEQLVLHSLPTDHLVRIENEVWTFDGSGALAPGDPRQNQQARWNYDSGINTLGKLLAEAAGAPVHHGCRVSGLKRHAGQWFLQSDCDIADNGFDAVLLTPPAPQTVELLAHSELGEAPGELLKSGLRDARYHAQWCFALGFQAPLERPENCFAMINTDRAHDVAWLSFENDKPGRDLGDATVIMVQMSPAWSVAYLNAEADTLVETVTEKALALLGEQRPTPTWWDSHRWRYAHPFQAADASVTASGGTPGAVFRRRCPDR